MLTWEDCLGLCELTPDEIDAIARHEHLPQLAALELGEYLVTHPGGAPAISRMILDDIGRAENTGDQLEALKLKLVLKHFVESHCKAGGQNTPRSMAV